MKMRLRCRGCAADSETEVLAVGEMPVCNRFAASCDRHERFPIEIGICACCGLVQLLEVPPTQAVRPQLPWIRYNEPGGHLDDVVRHLLALDKRPVTALGVGPFDGPLLNRLEAEGMSTGAIDLRTLTDANLAQPAYLETYQAGLLPELLSKAGIAGSRDLVICRYLIEHCHDPVKALHGLGGLLSSEGRLVVEVPDSRTFLQRQDYCFLWEEHVVYFTEETLRSLSAHAGFAVERLLRYPGLLEDALVAVLRPSDRAAAPVGESAIGDQLKDFRRYAEGFACARERWQRKLSEVAGQGGKVALMGIGHQAIMFVNAFGLSGFISFAVDDDQDKIGLFAPGFCVPVISSAELARQDVALCLMAVNPGVIRRIQDKLGPDFARKTEFVTIFSGLEP